MKEGFIAETDWKEQKEQQIKGQSMQQITEQSIQQITEQSIQQTLVSRHTAGVQQKLSNARVAVAGLGGLGSNVALALARIGVGHLHLVDFDRVELSNLNRQQYFLHQLGSFKTDALKGELMAVNPYLDIAADCVRVTEENIEALFGQEDIVCEAFDAPEQKAMLVNGILTHFPEKKLVSASGLAGFGNSNAIRTRRVTGNFYLCGDEVTEPSAGYGLMAPRAMLCAAHQANLITGLILGAELL